MSGLVPYLSFRTGDASVRLMTEVLGFEIVTDHRGDDGSIWHIELRRGEAVVMGGSGDVAACRSPGIYLVTDDVEDTYARAIAAGATSVYAPQDTEWGTRRARFLDPDGHEWTIGSYRPGTAPTSAS